MFLIALAILPGLLIAWLIYASDKHDPEPHRRLAICFGLGALSTIPALILEILGSNVAGVSYNIVETFIYAVIIIAGSEELVKFLFLKFYIYNHKDFSEPLDGIVYAMMVGMGFATLENILYVSQGGLGVALLRMFTAVPAHGAFAVLMGYFMGLARFEESTSRRQTYLALGFVVPVISHGLYDFFLFQQNYEGLAIFALVTLIVSIVFSARLIKQHIADSKERKENREVPDFTEHLNDFDKERE